MSESQQGGLSTAIDRDAVKAKYRAERDKRLRPDGNDQYLELVGQLAHYVEDPYVEVDDRQPVIEDCEVAVIGGGFAGLLCGARLSEAGVDDVRIIEKGGDFGGTWYWNRYPGAQCDTAAMIYLPLLEETGYMPTEKYTHGPEILDHCRRIAHQYGLYDGALLSTIVESLTWVEEKQRWRVKTDRGDVLHARFVTIGTGPLHKPKLPGIPGLETFEGHSFHTSRWDYDYTGGDPEGALLENLRDKRVGLVGTGATSIQVVPHLAKACGELYVFQRTPSSVDERNNEPIDPDWFASLEEGWQQRWRENFTTLQTGGMAKEDLVMDGWTAIAQRVMRKVAESGDGTYDPKTIMRAFAESDDEKMDEIRARVDRLVEDGDTAAALKPWYRQMCKRPCFHDEYLQAYNHPNVHLVDTDGQGIERITPTGAVVAGDDYPLDCLIYASGFEVGTAWERRSGFDPVGRGGVSLSKLWADGMETFHGMHVHGMPNAFLIGHAQAGALVSNVPHNLVEAAATAAAIIGHAQEVGAVEVETTPTAQEAWMEKLKSGRRRFGNNDGCTPGYYNNEGQPDPKRTQAALGYPYGPAAFFTYIDQWRSDGKFDGLSFG